jgi:Tubulin binding cofactor A
MKDDGRDPWDIKKFTEVLGESLMMVPDSEYRLRQAMEDLSEFVEANNELAEEWYETAQLLLREHTASNDKDDVQETRLVDLAGDEAF